MRYLVRLTELELIDRERRMVERRIRLARFSAVKSLDSFDFKAIPSLNKLMVLELARCEYVERRPPKLDLDVYPYLPRANVATTAAASYMSLLGEGAP